MEQKGYIFPVPGSVGVSPASADLTGSQLPLEANDCLLFSLAGEDAGALGLTAALRGEPLAIVQRPEIEL